MPKSLKIAQIASEVAPYSKSGGLGVVARSLPKAIKRLGHDVVVITPFYEKVINKEQYNLRLIKEGWDIKIDKKNTVKVDVYRGWLMEGLPIYFIGNKQYFSKKKSLYGSKNENARFYLFDLAALELLKMINYAPDIIHCHDWHSGLVPELLQERYKKDKNFHSTATLYTIHNLMYQLGHDWWSIPSRLRDDGKAPLPLFNENSIERINFVKRAILRADLINAVSENYAVEIMTKDFGEDLHIILKNRQAKLFGIVNGIDYDVYNPEKDPGIIRNYNYKKIQHKADNKAWLQKFLSLPVRLETPVIAMVTRITEQKGFDLLDKIIEPLLTQPLQIAILGGGDKKLISSLKKIQKNYPDQLGIYPKFTSKYETSFYAGSDMLLMPSRFEPCGLGQLISLRYGSVPIVRATGGLADTVQNFNPKNESGNGFVFNNYSSKELLIAIIRALENYKHSRAWKNLVIKGMKISNSWEIPAQKYEVLYNKAIKEANE
ncbi:MAG: glycogen synthase [Candidatus Komeilibacteria bacterium]